MIKNFPKISNNRFICYRYQQTLTEEDWDTQDYSKPTTYHKLTLPSSSIILVDTVQAFENFLDDILKVTCLTQFSSLFNNTKYENFVDTTIKSIFNQKNFKVF